MDKKIFIVIITLYIINVSIIFSQENKISNFNHRITNGRERNPSLNALGLAIGIQV